MANFRAPAGAAETLNDLPRKHLQHLFNEHQKKIPKSWNKQRRLERLAELLGPKGTQRYRNRYLPFNNSQFAWYLYDETLEEIPAIFNRMRRKRDILTGIAPELSEEDPLPRLHRMIDQGSHLIFEFGALDATRAYIEAEIRPSMESVGDCYDNAMCESFNATLECELLAKHRFKTQREAALAVFDVIEGWYNPHRRHSALGYLSPNNYERRMSDAA